MVQFLHPLPPLFDPHTSKLSTNPPPILSISAPLALAPASEDTSAPYCLPTSPMILPHASSPVVNLALVSMVVLKPITKVAKLHFAIQDTIAALL
jgi:hypothetical protein